MKKTLILAGLLFCLLLSACASSAELPAADDVPAATETQPPAAEEQAVGQAVLEHISCGYYDQTLVEAQLSAAEAYELDGKLLGGIVPHYAPAMYLTANLLAARETPPDTVVVIAPNHAGTDGNIQICGASYRWDTGELEGNAALAETLAAGLELHQSDRAARTDWSASLQIPYLARYFPEAQVVTIMLSRGADAAALTALGELLAQAAAEQSLFFLGSVDFSHEQTPEQAERCDRETQALIQVGDPAALLRLSNAYMDSPETVALLLEIGKACGLKLLPQDSYVETFLENGLQKAGTYYAYALKTDGGDVPASDPDGAADGQSAPE